MLKDITIGQYFPGKSVIHRMDPRVKILLSLAYIVMLFVAGTGWGLALGLTALLNMLFVQGDPIWHWWIITVTWQGISTAVFMAVRIVCLIAGTSLLTYTTSPIALTDGIERLLGPLKAVHLPVHELAMMMTIALRFIPTLIEETDKIMSAQKARGADMETGGLMQRAKALIPILIPLFVSAFRRADELALAMVCRCYHGGEGRTRMRQLQLSFADFGGSVITTLVFAAVIMLNILL